MKLLILIFAMSSFQILGADHTISIKDGVFGVPFHSKTEDVLNVFGQPCGIIQDNSGGELWLYSDELYLNFINSEFIGITIGKGYLLFDGQIKEHFLQGNKFKRITSSAILFNNIRFRDSFESVRDKVLNYFKVDIGENIKARDHVFIVDGYKISLIFEEMISVDKSISKAYELSAVKIVAVKKDYILVANPSPVKQISNYNININEGLFGLPFHSDEEEILNYLGPPSGIIDDKNKGKLWLYSDNMYIRIYNSKLIGVAIGHGFLPVNGFLSNDMKQVDQFKEITYKATFFNDIKFRNSFQYVRTRILENIKFDIGTDPTKIIPFEIDGYKISLRFGGSLIKNAKSTHISYELSLVEIEENSGSSQDEPTRR